MVGAALRGRRSLDGGSTETGQWARLRPTGRGQGSSSRSRSGWGSGSRCPSRSRGRSGCRVGSRQRHPGLGGVCGSGVLGRARRPPMHRQDPRPPDPSAGPPRSRRLRARCRCAVPREALDVLAFTLQRPGLLPGLGECLARAYQPGVRPGGTSRDEACQCNERERGAANQNEAQASESDQERPRRRKQRAGQLPEELTHEATCEVIPKGGSAWASDLYQRCGHDSDDDVAGNAARGGHAFAPAQ